MKVIENSLGRFEQRKEEKATEFLCDRENKTKKSKTIIDWIDTEGNKKTICNGCYGELLSKASK